MAAVAEGRRCCFNFAILLWSQRSKMMTRGDWFPAKITSGRIANIIATRIFSWLDFYADVATEWRESYLHGGTVIKLTYRLRRGLNLKINLKCETILNVMILAGNELSVGGKHRTHHSISARQQTNAQPWPPLAVAAAPYDHLSIIPRPWTYKPFTHTLIIFLSIFNIRPSTRAARDHRQRNDGRLEARANLLWRVAMTSM
jgi:hypothetical protein